MERTRASSVTSHSSADSAPLGLLGCVALTARYSDQGAANADDETTDGDHQAGNGH